MQLANVMLALGGDRFNVIPKYGVTPSELAVLQLIHGQDAVTDIEVLDATVERGHREELGRIREVYGAAKDAESQPVVNTLFPGAAARAFVDFGELELPEIFFKPGRDAPEPIAPEPDPLDGMTKTQLLAEAEKRGVEVSQTDTKAQILAALRAPVSAPASATTQASEPDIEEIDDPLAQS